MGRALQRRLGVGIVGCVVAVLGLTAAGAAEVPDAVKAAIEKHFPGATIAEIGREREHKVHYYEVEIEWKGKEIEIEVAVDGALGEVSQEIKQGELSADLAAKVTALVGKGKLLKIERTDRHGRPKGTTFEALDPVKTTYEIKYRDPVKKKKVEVKLAADGSKVVADDDDDDDDHDDNDHGDDDHDD